MYFNMEGFHIVSHKHSAHKIWMHVLCRCIFAKGNHSYHLYKCGYLIPVHIHPCKYNSNFQQYQYKFGYIKLIPVRTH